MSAAEFRVSSSFVLPGRRLFVLAGEVISGSIRPGMVLPVTDQPRSFTVPVHSVEFIDSPSQGRHEVGVTIHLRAAEWAPLLERSFPSSKTVSIRASPSRFRCPCCGHRTLDELPPGTHNICEVCFWEDDAVQFSDPDYERGANTLSLRQAAANYLKYGVSDQRFADAVRPPRSDEMEP